jgi:hypothetical protein
MPCSRDTATAAQQIHLNIRLQIDQDHPVGGRPAHGERRGQLNDYGLRALRPLRYVEKREYGHMVCPYSLTT